MLLCSAGRRIKHCSETSGLLEEQNYFCSLFLDLSLSITDYAHVFLSIVQELCESRGGRPGLSVLTSLLASVDVKNY